MIIVRYADDFIVGFQHESDAQRFLDEMRKRLGEFALSLHPEKTRLIEFGRFTAERRKRRGLGKPETFNFLGFTFICGKSRSGKFQIQRKTRRDRSWRSYGRSRKRCDGACTGRSPSRGNGWGRSSVATSTITQCRPILVHLPCSGTMSPISGGARCGGVARGMGARGHG